jgi:hypothetical protein
MNESNFWLLLKNGLFDGRSVSLLQSFWIDCKSQLNHISVQRK